MKDLLSDLRAGNGHIWVSNVPEKLENYSFSDRDIEKCQRFANSVDRETWLKGRAAVLVLLKRHYLFSTDATIEYRQHGQPFVPTCHGLEISISHTGTSIALAVSWGTANGVDIEYVDQEIDILSIARNFFEADELSDMEALSQSERKVSFFFSWTIKEAALKAVGMGLLYPLSYVQAPIITEPVTSFGVALEKGLRLPRQTGRAFRLNNLVGAAVGNVKKWRLFPNPFPDKFQLRSIRRRGLDAI